MNATGVIGRACAVALVAGYALNLGACSRDHIEAVELANEGDKSFKVNVEGAISKYEQAAQLDPKNHRILWKLSRAYEKKEDWEKMASTLTRALAIAPEFANYWYKRGFALMQIARGGEADRYEEAKEPLQKCIEKDPNYAECYHELGEAMLWTDEVQKAVENYVKSIEHDPTVGYFYAPLGQVLYSLKLYEPAEKILKEGIRVLEMPRAVTPQQADRVKGHLYTNNVLLAKMYQAKGDTISQVSALEKAEAIGGQKHPEIKFNLGSTYATMKPPKKEKAVRMLKSFSKRGCKGKSAKKFKEQCTQSATLIQQLGGS